MQGASAVPMIMGITGLANAGLGASATIMGGRAEASAMNQNARLADYNAGLTEYDASVIQGNARISLQNAKIAEENAKLALADAALSDIITANRMDEIRGKVSGDEAQLASAYAARGIVVDSGSQLELANQVELESERQVLQENLIGNRESQGLRFEAKSLLFQGRMHRYESDLQNQQAGMMRNQATFQRYEGQLMRHQGKVAKQQALFGGISGFFAQSSAMLPMFAKQPQQKLGESPLAMASASPQVGPRPLTTNRKAPIYNMDF